MNGCTVWKVRYVRIWAHTTLNRSPHTYALRGDKMYKKGQRLLLLFFDINLKAKWSENVCAACRTLGFTSYEPIWATDLGRKVRRLHRINVADQHYKGLQTQTWQMPSLSMHRTRCTWCSGGIFWHSFCGAYATELANVVTPSTAPPHGTRIKELCTGMPKVHRKRAARLSVWPKKLP